jgi:DNA helicase HerA-like ATPase
MAYEIVIGRNEEDKKKYNLLGTVFIGRHYVKMGQVTSLSNDILLDVNRSHVFFICGKRGSGKSYTMGAIAEGIANLPPEIAKNTAVLIFDTMGIYWTMKYPNHKDAELLKEWDLEGKGLDIKLYAPTGFFKEYKEKGIPVDSPFAIKPSELGFSDWCLTFGLDKNKSPGVLIGRVISKLKKEKKEYSIDDIIKEIGKDDKSEDATKHIVENQFTKVKDLGLFSVKGTKLKDIIAPGQVTVLDISVYAMMPGAADIRALVIGLISQKLFIERMVSRKKEEYTAVHKATHYFAEETKEKHMPLVWLMIDEAHEFLPKEGKTTASDALITILREGREPGISLILASQQPGKIHTDVMTQADTVIAHRVTAKIDVDALGALMQSYMRKGLDVELNVLPRVKGAAIVFDDMNERIYPMRVRPRFTWHGGEAPVAIRGLKKEFKL